MTTMYIISAIILASIVTSVIFVLISKIEHNRKLNLNWFLLMIIIALVAILTMVLIYHGQNDKNNISVAYENGYEIGRNDGLAETRIPTNEEMEDWFSSTKEVIVATNEGGDLGVHIIDSNGEEWVLFADSVVNK